MKRIGRAIRQFFFPPAGTPTWLKVLPYALLGVLTLFLIIGASFAWDYTNSPEFCGTSCHTMPPEYNAYLISPHARISCTECHLGRGYLATQFSRKAGDLKHVTKTLFKDYEFPIRADDMRPARESCEKCHFPGKFSDDSLREIRQFVSDKTNTPISTYLTLKTGGGSKRQGMGRGIHWHVENRVLYLPTGDLEQTIPFVREYHDDGSFTDYVDPESGIDPASIDESQLKEMDCITCHNRITHLVKQPEEAVDGALTAGLIDSSIPEIRRKGIEVLRAEYPTLEFAANGIAGLEGYYQVYYADFYKDNKELVQGAIATLQDIYQQSVFPEQKSDWNTHEDNIGHQFSPGCFRCHDGKHLNEKDEAIRLECNLCHSIPVVAGENDFVTKIEISRGPEPEAHKSPNWINLHRQAFDDTCQNCHTTEDAGGTSNTSFCSNSACHGNVWTYASFDAPAIRALMEAQAPKPTSVPEASGPISLTYNDLIGPILTTRCGSCHGSGNAIKDLNLTTYQTAMQGSVDGAVILPGDPKGSKIIQIQSGDQPHFGQLAPLELQQLIDWITAGAPEK